MAVITPSALISEIRGSVGMQTFSKNRWGPYVKAKLVQVNPNTLPQQDVRAAQAAAVAEWQGLTQAVMNKWIDYANGNVISGRISRKFLRAGYSEYISRCMNRFAVSGMGSGFEPLPKVRLFPIITNLSQGVADISVSFDTMKPIGNCDLVVYATPPISPGINEINPSLFRIIGTITPAAQISSANIYSAYTSTFPLAAPDIGKKIGIALKAVNTDNFAAGRFFFIQTIISASLIPNVQPQIIESAVYGTVNTRAATITFTNAPEENSLIVVQIRIPSARTWAVPSGFNLLYSITVDNPCIYTYYKIAGASEPLSYTFTYGGSATNNTAIGYNISPVNTVTPFHSYDTNENTGTSLSNATTPLDPPAESLVLVFTGFANVVASIAFDNSFINPIQSGIVDTTSPRHASASRIYTSADTNQNCITTWTTSVKARGSLLVIQ